MSFYKTGSGRFPHENLLIKTEQTETKQTEFDPGVQSGQFVLTFCLILKYSWLTML